MALESKEGGSHQEWKDEIGSRVESVARFLQKYFEMSFKDRPTYDAMTDLHLSAGGPEVIEKLRQGTGTIFELKTLYKNGTPIQIYVVFSSEGRGNNLDVYFYNKALADYLHSIEGTDSEEE
ncbi:MAG: hypothetical protein A3H59_03700 [Candidatus Jacksonbacteria bacterium RIFCSPLOWO2_02_FULL_43_9]|nr:MAG: hypothetical protein UV70_C0010G0046 [Parcubacteria group bacterium GW2011_GWA2_43_13]OGY69691.1 MAG: hypothetical protein A3B94_02420 [Candidatus Jacksonbacteria bacterium RIFCSPHIGHO2_02_FULL_43_10]OGY70711.1 MAG: hypothetical protein A2986_02985 [Candidatus Jacksonbacteria bacterium RIFCSPLOWO2_01_FULL_44_13]OGY74303.1 MAG: hypothetical protein A3H59_03700 [Candidatus Jacksonbacteria bacterium RIFCSPLOWO2_02_FULL_43_9]HAZ16694.1 hypothetical protein [Candidatus Jacksonbacteria bacter